jgi:hypothetical protein
MTRLGHRFIRRQTLTTVAAAALIVAAPTFSLASAATAGHLTPFEASLSGTVTDVPGCTLPTVCATATDHGTATHLGVATLTKTFTVHITQTTCPGGGTFTTYTEMGALTGANGDSLDVNGAGIACVVNGHALASGQLNVTSGTGRFTSTRGTLDERIDHNLSTHTETVSLSGTVSSPGQ